MWDWFSIVCCFVDVLKFMSCSCSMCLFYTSLVCSWAKVELISNEALTHRITDPSWWFGFGSCGNAGTAMLKSVVYWCCLIDFINQNSHGFHCDFAVRHVLMLFFCCVAKSRGIPITPSNSSVIEWGRMLGSTSASKVPSFGLSAHCQSAVVSRGTSLLGMKCPDEKRQSCSHRSQPGFSRFV